jgi:hypothetical protein
MALNKYSIEDLHFLFAYRYYLTKDRFFYYLKVKLALNDKELQTLWSIFNEFPKNIYNKELHESIDKVLQLTLPLIKKLVQISENKCYLHHNFTEAKTEVKLYYLENKTESASDFGNVQEIIFNFLDPMSLLPYSELMQRDDIVILGMLKFFDKLNLPDNKELKVYEGDFFTTNDSFWNDKKSSIFLIQNNSIYKLNYVPGKGYLKSNGSPNIDEDTKYSTYAITGCETWQKLGSIVKDINILRD